MEMPKVSVIVTNFNGLDDLSLSLDALLKTTYPNVELIVADCCTPNLFEWMKVKYPSITCIHFCEDIGIGALRNAGFQHIDKSTSYVCYVDDDIVVVPDWLENMVKSMEDSNDIGAIHPIRFNYLDKSKIDGLGNFMTHIGFPLKIEPTEENLSILKSKRTMDIFYGETAVMLIRAKILFCLDSSLEPFDSDYIFAWEDIDLSWRIWLLNYRVVITCEAYCYHNRELNTRVAKLYDSRYVYLVTRGRFISMLKNYEVSSLIRYLPVAIAIDVLKAFLLVCYKPGHAVATFKGLLWGLINFQHIIDKRHALTPHKKRRNAELDGIFIKTSLLNLIDQFRLNWG